MTEMNKGDSLILFCWGTRYSEPNVIYDARFPVVPVPVPVPDRYNQ